MNKEYELEDFNPTGHRHGCGSLGCDCAKLLWGAANRLNKFYEKWSNQLFGLIPEGDESKLSDPKGAQESIILDCFKVYRDQLDSISGMICQDCNEVLYPEDRVEGWIHSDGEYECDK